MATRDALEHVVRAWDAHEARTGGGAIVDYDCAPPAEPVAAASDRFAVLDQLENLRADASPGPVADAIEAHRAYLGCLLGEHPDLGSYIAATQGCAPRGWTQEYVEHRGDLAREALADLGVSWGPNTRDDLNALSEDVPADAAGDVIRSYADKHEATIRDLTGATAEFTLTVESVDLDAYWSYWLDGAGHDARLRINTRRAAFTQLDAYRFALHEVLGHALQYSNLAGVAETSDVDWPRLLAVHAPHQVLFEGLAQVLPLAAAPTDPAVTARTRLDHYTQLVSADLHRGINAGGSASECWHEARSRVPFWTGNDVASLLRDRTLDPQLRTYLWAYPAGIDWFMNLHEAGGSLLAEVLRDGYQRPLSPGELEQRWPSGPRIGGDA